MGFEGKGGGGGKKGTKGVRFGVEPEGKGEGAALQVVFMIE